MSGLCSCYIVIEVVAYGDLRRPRQQDYSKSYILQLPSSYIMTPYIYFMSRG